MLRRREQLDLIPAFRDRLSQTLANLVIPLEATARQDLWDKANDLRQHIWNATRPWEYRKVLTPQEKIDAMVQTYKETIGDPNDPTYAAEIDRQLHYWETGEVLPAAA